MNFRAVHEMFSLGLLSEGMSEPDFLQRATTGEVRRVPRIRRLRVHRELTAEEFVANLEQIFDSSNKRLLPRPNVTFDWLKDMQTFITKLYDVEKRKSEDLMDDLVKPFNQYTGPSTINAWDVAIEEALTAYNMLNYCLIQHMAPLLIPLMRGTTRIALHPKDNVNDVIGKHLLNYVYLAKMHPTDEEITRHCRVFEEQGYWSMHICDGNPCHAKYCDKWHVTKPNPDYAETPYPLSSFAHHAVHRNPQAFVHRHLEADWQQVVVLLKEADRQDLLENLQPIVPDEEWQEGDWQGKDKGKEGKGKDGKGEG